MVYPATSRHDSLLGVLQLLNMWSNVSGHVSAALLLIHQYGSQLEPSAMHMTPQSSQGADSQIDIWSAGHDAVQSHDLCLALSALTFDSLTNFVTQICKSSRMSTLHMFKHCVVR